MTPCGQDGGRSDDSMDDDRGGDSAGQPAIESRPLREDISDGVVHHAPSGA